MATRSIYDETATPPLTGTTLLTQYADHLKVLLDKISLPVTSPAGTNTYTGTIDPAFDGDGYVAGMKFSIQWPNTNTSATVTLNLNSEGATSVKEPDGSAPAIGALVSGERAHLEYTGTEFRLIAPTAKWIESNAAITPTAPTKQIFTASGTWTKPAGCRFVKAIVTGPGGGGADTAGTVGGPNGATVIAWLDVTAISSATITIGTGATGSTTASPTSASTSSSWADGVNTVTGAAGNASANTQASGGDLNLWAMLTGDSDGSPSFWGPGGQGNVTTALAHAQNPGSGGGRSTGSNGGDGADGIIVVEEFY